MRSITGVAKELKRRALVNMLIAKVELEVDVRYIERATDEGRPLGYGVPHGKQLRVEVLGHTVGA